QLNSAVRALPTCSRPVGLGAKRTRSTRAGYQEGKIGMGTRRGPVRGERQAVRWSRSPAYPSVRRATAWTTSASARAGVASGVLPLIEIAPGAQCRALARRSRIDGAMGPIFGRL